MSEHRKLYLAATGMATPTGMDAQMTYSALQAGLNRYAEISILHDESQIRMARVPDGALRHALDTDALRGTLTRKQLRMLRLATLAMFELAPRLPATPIPLFLAGPDAYTDAAGITGLFAENLALQTDTQIDLRNSRFVSQGRAGSINVIDTAFKYLSISGNHYALVGGVDSFYDIKTLEYLNQKNRLLKKDAPSGFVPGEGAAFLLLVSPEALTEEQAATLPYVTSPGSAFETEHIFGSGHSRGEALAEAFTAALNNDVITDSMKVEQVYSSENAEACYARELSIALGRNRQSLVEDCDVQRPATCLGDLGAAFAPVAIGLASIRQRPGSVALVYAASDSGPRAALCVVAAG